MTEPTEPRVHRTTVVHTDSLHKTVAYLPDGWEPGTPVVVSTVPPDGLWPGPDGTWFASAATAAKLNYAATDDMGDDRQWVSPESFDPNQVVLCRPVPAPEPATVRVPWWDAVGRKMDEDTVITKLVAEKRLNDPDMAVQVWNDDGTWIDPYEDEDDDGMVTVLRDADPTPTDPPSEQGDAVVGRCMTEGCPGHWTGTEECTYSPAPSVVPADSPATQRDGWDLDEDGYPQFYEKGKPDETIRLSYDAACALVTVLRDADPTATETPSETELLEDDLLYMLRVRNRLAEIAASAVHPGPDHADYTIRRDLILEWLNEARDDVDSGHLSEWSGYPWGQESTERPDPAPSVVPADSPDTGRWELDVDGDPVWVSAPDAAASWALTPNAVLEATALSAIEATKAHAALAALVRRDRPQPTAEQVVAEINRRHRNMYELFRDHSTAEVAQAFMAAIDACRTTEGTGE